MLIVFFYPQYILFTNLTIMVILNYLGQQDDTLLKKRKYMKFPPHVNIIIISKQIFSIATNMQVQFSPRNIKHTNIWPHFHRIHLLTRTLKKAVCSRHSQWLQHILLSCQFFPNTKNKNAFFLNVITNIQKNSNRFNFMPCILAYVLF